MPRRSLRRSTRTELGNPRSREAAVRSPGARPRRPASQVSRSRHGWCPWIAGRWPTHRSKMHSRQGPRRYPGSHASLVMRRAGTPLPRARMPSVACVFASRFEGRRRGFCGGPVLRDARQRPDGGRRGARPSPIRDGLAPRASGNARVPLCARPLAGGDANVGNSGACSATLLAGPPSRAARSDARCPSDPPLRRDGDGESRGGRPPGTRIVTWLILPVVICLSQRLSHACLSISTHTVKLRMAH